MLTFSFYESSCSVSNSTLESFIYNLFYFRANPSEGPWKVSVESVNSYKPVMSYSPDRDLRKLVWENLVTLGSVKYTTAGYSNKQAIDGVRFAR